MDVGAAINALIPPAPSPPNKPIPNAFLVDRPASFAIPKAAVPTIKPIANGPIYCLHPV